MEAVVVDSDPTEPRRSRRSRGAPAGDGYSIVAPDGEPIRWTVERAELCGAGSSGVAANGTRYIVYVERLQWSREEAKLCEAAGPSPFTDPTHGAWQTDPTHGAWQTDLHRRGTRYLWAGYRYQPPQMGFWVDPPGAPVLGVYGASTGTNRLGQYYCWNRVYDINAGRWTTPDPINSPNLFDYAGENPAEGSDPTGLRYCVMLNDSFNDWLTQVNSTGKAYTTDNAAETCRRLKKAYDMVKNSGNHSLKSACIEENTKAWNNCPDCSDPPPEMPEQLKPPAESPGRSDSRSAQLAMFGLLYAESAAAGSKNAAGKRFAAIALVVIGIIMVERAIEKRRAFDSLVDELEKWVKRVSDRAKGGCGDPPVPLDRPRDSSDRCREDTHKCIERWVAYGDHKAEAISKCVACQALCLAAGGIWPGGIICNPPSSN